MSGEANQALELDDQPEAALNDEPMCDHICLLREGHVEEGRPHFYGYRLGPGSPSQLVAEVERLTQERDTARDIAVALEQQTAEALRIALLPLDGYDLSENFDQMPWAMRALRKIVRLLETENQ